MDLILQPYDWTSKDENGAFTVNIYGHTRDQPDQLSQQVLVRIEDYQPFCQIELPSTVEGRPANWNIGALKIYTQWLKPILENGNHTPTKILYREMEKLYNFNNHKTYPFLICYFETEEAMKHCINVVGKRGYDINGLGYIRARVWETSITTLHRMIIDMKVGYGQWLSINVKEVHEIDRISYCDLEYVASWEQIEGIHEDQSKSWTVSPKLAAIDIECYSHNHRAMPNGDYVEDVVFQISYITQRLNHPETRKKHLLVAGECDDIPGAEVIRYDHEIQVIDGLTEIIKDTNPAMILGYNIFGFDFPYLDARLKLYMREWKPCGLIKDQPSFVDIKTWKSGAYGHVTIAPLVAEGRICLDMYPIIKRDHKLDRYTLDFVANHFLDHGKHDVTAREMFRIYQMREDAKAAGDQVQLKEATAEMAKVGAYCLEDSCLCIDLMQKLSIWIMLAEMATIVCVKPYHVFTQGQQIRVQNQVYQRAHCENYVIDERAGSKEGFKGGSVQSPIPGKYHNILIFDFASLYPSIIRAFNICYTTYVPPESQIPDDMCHILAWSELDDNKKSPTFGQTTHYRYRFIKQQYYHGVLPRMCEHLVNARKAVRRQISPKNDPKENEVLNQRQLGLKVSANSVFGALGVKEGYLPMPEASRAITATGRSLIKIASDYVEKKYGGKVTYGDSVTKDTPILVREHGQIRWVCIEYLCEHVKSTKHKSETHIQDKEIQVWSDVGWTRIKRIICHKTTKKLYRVVTHTGVVDVTEDHSLLLPNGNEVHPWQVQVGTQLMHKDLPPLPTDGNLTEEEAWVWGFFYGDGSCGSYNCPSGDKSSWALNNTNLDYLNYAKAALAKCEPNYNFKILETMKSSQVYKLVPLCKTNAKIVHFVQKYRELFYNEDRHKIVPEEVLRARKEVKIAFMNGYYSADGDKTTGSIRMDNKGKIGASGLYHLLSDLGYNVSINTRSDKDQIYRLNASLNPYRRSSDTIKKIVELPSTDDFVYDLETENHHFSAGVGRLVVHNTDSIMVNLNLTDPNECLEWGNKLAKELSALYPDPLEMEFEAVYALALFVSKKRYAAVPQLAVKLETGDRITRVSFSQEHNRPDSELYRLNIYRDDKDQVKYLTMPRSAKLASIELPLDETIIIQKEEDQPTFTSEHTSGTIVPVIAGIPVKEGGEPNPKDVSKKGIVLARRDNCLWLRENYMDVLLSIMFDKPLPHTMNIIDNAIENMMTRHVPFAKMVITKAIGRNYKPNSTYPLKIFMDELRKRGHVVQAGDRLDYVFVEDAQGRDKQGYRMRLVEMFWQNVHEEPLDYIHYIEKILKNPIEQIFYLAYKDQIDEVAERCKPEKRKRGKIYTYLSKEYINTRVKLIRQKAGLIQQINEYRPHFTTQDPEFSQSLIE